MEEQINNKIKSEENIEKNKYLNESFMENYDNKDIDFNNLTFNRTKTLGKNYFLLVKIIKEKKIDIDINIIHALLRKSYIYDNTNLDTIKELVEIKKLLKSSDRKGETKKIIELNQSLIQKNNNYYFEKILQLITLLSNYNSEDIKNKYDIENYLLKEIKPLKKVVLNFNNDISIDNTALYFCSLYYNWLYCICNKLEKSINETSEENEEGYYENIFEDNKERNNLKKDIQNICIQIMEILEIKDVNIDIEKFNIENFESIVDKKINKEMVKEFSKLENRDKIKDLMMLREIPKIKKVEKMKSNLREKNKILKRYNIYINWFYTEY